MAEKPNDTEQEPTIDLPDVDQGGGDDSLAKKERAAIQGDDYEEDGKKQDHRRNQGLKNVAYYGMYCLMWFGILLLITFVSIWAYHILSPSCWHWLPKEGIDHIQTILFSGALSAALTLLGKKVL